MATIWAEVFEFDQIGLDDDFFALGGHSLLAIRVLATIYDSLQVKISLLDMLTRGKTVRTMAVLLEEALLLQTDDEELLALLAEIQDEEELQKLLLNSSFS
jgi:hypothetical protein